MFDGNNDVNTACDSSERCHESSQSVWQNESDNNAWNSMQDFAPLDDGFQIVDEQDQSREETKESKENYDPEQARLKEAIYNYISNPENSTNSQYLSDILKEITGASTNQEERPPTSDAPQNQLKDLDGAELSEDSGTDNSIESILRRIQQLNYFQEAMGTAGKFKRARFGARTR